MITKFSIAPMMNVTDRHCRVFLRRLCARMKLYTDMKVSAAVIHGERARFLDFDPCERPLALQLAGSDPAQLARCARLAGEAGYDEVNLNVGCPSARVTDGRFGACLMAEPELVSRCVAAMVEALAALPGAPPPVTVKTRIGIDHHDDYHYLAAFVERVSRGGCAHFIIHARKAWLQGLSPKENRLAPELRYDRVYRLKRDFPDLGFTINGGVQTLEQALEHLRHVDGVMVGREANRDPWMLSAVDEAIFGEAARPPSAAHTRAGAVRAYLPYVERQLARGVHLRRLVRPMLGLYHGQPGARGWRRRLSGDGARAGAGVEVIERALRSVQADERRANEREADDNDELPFGGAALPQRARGACPAVP